MAISNGSVIDPEFIYLSLRQNDDGTIYLADQDGRKVRGIRSLNPDLHFDGVATCSADLVLFRPGTAEKYVNKTVSK